MNIIRIILIKEYKKSSLQDYFLEINEEKMDSLLSGQLADKKIKAEVNKDFP